MPAATEAPPISSAVTRISLEQTPHHAHHPTRCRFHGRDGTYTSPRAKPATIAPPVNLMTDTTESYFARLVDEPALEGYLTDHLGPAEDYDVTHHQAGHSNETLFVTWGNRDLVLRRPPPGETADTAHDVLREYTVIHALQDTPVRVPRTVLACEDDTVIGAEFYLMERESGDVMREDELDRFATPGYRRQAGRELIDALAEIHAVDYDAVGLGDLGYPDGYTERQVDRWTKQYEWATEVTADIRELPLIDDVGAWLRENLPASYPFTLVHGDYMFHNVMFAPGTPPTLTAIFDWELSTLGDPRADLGWLFATYWDAKDPAPVSLRPNPRTYTAREGYPTRRELVDWYEARTGIAFEHERFYRTLAVYKLGALGEMFYRRFLEGNADDPLYPEMEAIVPKIGERATRIIAGEEPL